MSKPMLANLSESGLKRKLDAYFAKKGHKTITGLALHLGVSRRWLLELQKTDIHGPLIEEAKLKCENKLEEKLISGVPSAGIIFVLKNNYGWKDKFDFEGNINSKISLIDLHDKAKKVRQERDQENIIEGDVEEPKQEELPDKLF